jgi:hypothetical protein
MDTAEWSSYFYMMIEAEPTPEMLRFLTKNEKLENVQHTCHFIK